MTRTVRMTQPQPTSIHCTACGLEWTVSQEDPDTTLDDARQHVTRRHDIAPAWWHHLIKDGRA